MTAPNERDSFLARTVRFCLENQLVVWLATLMLVGWGVLTAPFDWSVGPFPRDPVPVDAIPDIGENQQIVFTEWPGRSPQNVEDQVTYPLTVNLLGIAGVKDIRSQSFFGFSTIFIIFEEDIEFYWSRSRILEKLGSLPAGTLPEGVQPAGRVPELFGEPGPHRLHHPRVHGRRRVRIHVDRRRHILPSLRSS